MCDVNDTKVAERTYLNVGTLGLRAAKRAKVPEMHLASGRQLLYTLSVEPAVHQTMCETSPFSSEFFGHIVDYVILM